MEKIELQRNENGKEASKNVVKPPENLPVENFEIEIDINGEMARDRAVEIGLKNKDEINFFVDLESGNSLTRGKRAVLKLAREMVEESGNFCEAMELFEYYGSYPGVSVADRKEFKDNAERARLILESKRDKALSPFDRNTELEEIRRQRKKIVKAVKDGRMTRETGLKISRDSFEEFKKERDWQRDGIEYFKNKITEDMMGAMQTSAGVSALEGRMILENEKEREEFISENGRTAEIELLEVPVGSFDTVAGRIDFVERIKEEISSRASSYRLTEEHIEYLENNVLAELMNKRVDMVLAIKKYPDHNRLFEETVKRRGMDKYKNEIIPTPFIFYLRVGELEDYASLYYEKDSISISSEEMKSVEKTGGFYVDGKNYVVGKNTRNGHFSQKDFKVFVHEEQHFFDRIFSDAKSFYGYEGYLDSAAGYLFQEEIKTGKKDLEKIVREVGRALRGFRTYYEWRAASEFLSYFKEGKPIEDIVDILKKNKNDGGLYDYFDREKREKIFEYVSKNFSDVGSFEIVNQVLIEEYNKILDSATEALTRLTKVGRMVRGEKVINFLQNLSLPRWLPETKKLLKGKKEKNI